MPGGVLKVGDIAVNKRDKNLEGRHLGKSCWVEQGGGMTPGNAERAPDSFQGFRC